MTDPVTSNTLIQDRRQNVENRNRRFRPIAIFLTALALTAGVLGAAVAQEATPAAARAHPGHIHAGSCATLGDVVFPLDDTVGADASATPTAMTVATPAAGGGPVVAESVSTIELALDDILAAEHAINLHESVENIGSYIACGDITGTPTDGMLTIELAELNGSGVMGDAMLMDNGDGTTEVTVTLMETGAMATPEASSGDAVTVEIADFAFGSGTITIPVGGSVTWTNLDAAPHTATAMDRDLLQTGTLNQGESFTQTFDTPGTYEYFCEFHPNMSGVLIAE